MSKRLEVILTEEQGKYLEAKAHVLGVAMADVVRILIEEDKRTSKVVATPEIGKRNYRAIRAKQEKAKGRELKLSDCLR